MTDYRICTHCNIHHYENCPTCFGFGLKYAKLHKTLIPIGAGEAEKKAYPKDWQACPDCKSTPRGIPTDDR